MECKAFTDLRVFQKAYCVSLEVHRKSLRFPSYEEREIARQLRRSTKSICANLAEGFGKRSYSAGEFRRFLQMGIGSANESLVWIRYCSDLGYISAETYEQWTAEYDAIAKMLSNLHRSWKALI